METLHYQALCNKLSSLEKAEEQHPFTFDGGRQLQHCKVTLHILIQFS